VSDVVIRCPNCGTTQPALGECEACHDAATRWFCPNHTPGLWLDAPECPRCGARFTGRPAADRPPPPRPTPPRPPPPRARRAPVEPPRPAEPDVVEEGPWIEPPDPARWPGRARWPGGGEWPRMPRVPRVPGEVPFPTVRVGVGSLVGCLGRVVMLVVILVVVAMFGFFGYCGAFPFAGERVGVSEWGAERQPPARSVAAPPGGREAARALPRSPVHPNGGGSW